MAKKIPDQGKRSLRALSPVPDGPPGAELEPLTFGNLPTPGKLRMVVYARVSKKGDRSIREQVKVAERDADMIGAVIVAVFSDKLSASRYRRVDERPGFVATKDFIRDGKADLLWTFAHNRSHRDLDDYVPLRRLVIDTKTLWRYGRRTYDLTLSADRKAANSDALRAEEQSDDISDATSRTIEDNLDAGRPHGRVPRGYKIIRCKVTGESLGRKPIKAQAKIIQAAALRVLDLETLDGVAKDLAPAWKEAGGKGELTAKVLRSILINPTYAGLRTSGGQVVRKGTWKRILSVETHRQLHDMLTNPARVTHQGSEPAYMLTHIARCDACKGVVKHFPRKVKRKDGAVVDYDYYGCPVGHVGRNVAKTDAYVEELLLQLLEHPEVAARLRAPEDDVDDAPTVDDELAKIARLQQKLEEFARDAARQGLGALVIKAYQDEVQSQIAEVNARIKAMVADPVLEKVVGENAREIWADMDLLQKREVIRHSIEVAIYKVPPRGRYTEIGVKVRPIGALAPAV